MNAAAIAPLASLLPSGAAAAGEAAEIILHDVSLAYGRAPVVTGLSGRFLRGTLTAVIGPNGSGKTTLLKGLLGLIRPCAGSIVARQPRRNLAYLAQASEMDMGFPVTVEDFVSVGLWSKIGGLRGVAPGLAQQVSDAIAAVGMQGQARRGMEERSGGQLQRMRFARLLVQDAPVVLLDEPFAGVDEETTRALLGLVAAWHAQGKTVIAVLHDRDMVAAHFPQALAVAGRMVAWGETPTVLEALALRAGTAR